MASCRTKESKRKARRSISCMLNQSLDNDRILILDHLKPV